MPLSFTFNWNSLINSPFLVSSSFCDDTLSVPQSLSQSPEACLNLFTCHPLIRQRCSFNGIKVTLLLSTFLLSCQLLMFHGQVLPWCILYLFILEYRVRGPDRFWLYFTSYALVLKTAYTSCLHVLNAAALILPCQLVHR